jgi:hypothetical protein
MLLYLAKHSRPDTSNVVRELSICMDGATIWTYLELLRIIKCVLDTKSFGIPLSYVVRELDEPIDLIDNDDYLTNLVSRAPL